MTDADIQRRADFRQLEASSHYLHFMGLSVAHINVGDNQFAPKAGCYDYYAALRHFICFTFL